VSFGKVTPEQKQEVEKFELIIYSWDEFLEVVSYRFSYNYSLPLQFMLLTLSLEMIKGSNCFDCFMDILWLDCSF
jgi:hypothetical protein